MKPVFVVVKTYNRASVLMRLLRDLRREVPLDALVFVFNDGSTEDYSHVESFLSQMNAEMPGPWHYHRFEQNHGKKEAWKMMNAIFREIRDKGALGGNVFFLDDDMRLCRDFFRRAFEAWASIQSPKKGTLHLLVDDSRQGRSCWTGVEPAEYNDLVNKTQWVDGAFLCDREFFVALNWRVDPIDSRRWENPKVSTGVGEQISHRLHRRRIGMYEVKRSLVVHADVESRYNPNERKTNPLRTVDFVDDESRAAALVSSPGDVVQASLASIPSRESALRQVVERLSPQVDLLRVYLNGYDKVPSFLRRRGVVFARSQDHGDRGDAGKFFWCEEGNGYQLTCDDDLLYPDDYVSKMVEAVEWHDRQAVVGLHGVKLRSPMHSYYGDRSKWHFAEGVREPLFVHILGTGCMAYHAHTLVVRKFYFEQPNMADIWMGMAAQRQRVPMAVVPREEGWLQPIPTPNRDTIYDRHRNNDGPQTEAVKRIWPWQIFEPRKS